MTWARVSAADELCPATLVGSTTVTNDQLTVLRPTISTLQAGDVLVQLNSYALRGCPDLARALDEAESQHLIPMLIVRRDGALRPITLEFPTPTVTPAPVPPTPTLPLPTVTLPIPASPTAAPRSTGAPAAVIVPPVTSDAAVPAPAPPPPAAPGLVATLRAFADNIRRPLQRPEPFVSRLAALRTTYDAAPSPAAEPIIGYYETVAAILKYKEERPEDEVPDDATTRRVTGSRRQPDVIFDYTDSGPLLQWLRQYPFLMEAVIRVPSGPLLGSGFEVPGRWIPDEAVTLLLDRAQQEIGTLRN